MKRIPIAGPLIAGNEAEYAAEAAKSAWYGSAGVFNKRFEEGFAEYIGVKHAVSLPSCTSGLHLALAAGGVGPGDEVIVPDVTWIASSAPIAYVGATPVFADIDAETWCLSAGSFEACITPKTKAVIAVDLYGSMPDMRAIREIAAKHGILLIEDAAEALGSECDGKMAGSLGEVSAFSFHGSKTLTTGEGGMLATDDSDLFKRVLFLRDHGRRPGDTRFQNEEVAFKYKMSPVQAALGLAQLENVEKLVEGKRRIFDWYAARLGEDPRVTLNAEPGGTKNSYWMSTVIVDEKLDCPKMKLVEELDAAGIDSRPFFSPLSSIPAYRETKSAAAARERNTVGPRVSAQGVNLPSALILEEADVARVCEAVLGVIEKCPGK